MARVVDGRQVTDPILLPLPPAMDLEQQDKTPHRVSRFPVVEVLMILVILALLAVIVVPQL